MGAPNTRKEYTNWSDAIARFQENNVKIRKFQMGSPNSAQVTRVRILSTWDTRGFDVITKGDCVIFRKG